MQSYTFEAFLQVHHAKIKNATEESLIWQNKYPPHRIVPTFNCDPEAANKVFLAEVQSADNLTKAFVTNVQLRSQESLLEKVAQIDFFNAITELVCPFGNIDELTAQREDFDLKADALSQWRD